MANRPLFQQPNFKVFLKILAGVIIMGFLAWITDAATWLRPYLTW